MISRDGRFGQFANRLPKSVASPRRRRRRRRRRLDVERKQAQAIASSPDSITHYYAYSNEDFTVISLRLPVP